MNVDEPLKEILQKKHMNVFSLWNSTPIHSNSVKV